VFVDGLQHAASMQDFKELSIWSQFADCPVVATYVTTHFQYADEALQRALLEAVDESTYSLREWLEALILLSQWLQRHHLHLSIQNQLSYVSCAAASGATLSDLPILVHDFLDQYGCARARKK